MTPRRPVAIAAALIGAFAAAMFGTSAADAALLGNVSVSNGEAQVSANGGSATWTVTQAGANISVAVGGGNTVNAGTGCTQTNASTVTCPATSIVVNFTANTGGQTLNMTGSMPSTVIGSNFADTLNGGSGPDRISGRQGADVINGNAGSDTAFYGTENQYGEPEDDRTQGVTVTLDGVANDGSQGYDAGSGGAGGDNVTASTENVYGTAFADTLVGDSQSNLLDGRRGPDVLTGGLGSDRLIGQFGNDTLNANDGIADAEVNCNNSDDSRDEQPNTVNYDVGLDNPVNCAISSGGSSGGGGGSAPGTLRPLSFLKSNWTLADTSASWRVPTYLEPQASKAGRYKFATRRGVRDTVGKAGVPIRIQEKAVGITGVPRAMQRQVTDGAVVGLSPRAGTSINGSTTTPGLLTVTYYDSLQDRRGGCKYDDALVSSVKGTDADLAWRILKGMKCRLTIKQRFGGTDPNPIVYGAAVKEDKADGKPRLLLRVRYPTPDSLDMVVMPRDPATLAGSTTWADQVGGELSFGYQKDKDQLGMALRRAPRNLTTISVLVKDTAMGLPVVSDGPGATCRQLLDVRLLDPNDAVIASQVSASANGRVTFTFGTPKAGEYSIVAMTTPASTAECSPLDILYGTQHIQVINSTAPFATVDGRCFASSGSGERLKWNGLDCDSAAAKDIDRLSGLVRDAVLARVFTGRPGGITGNERAKASRICVRDSTSTYGSDILVYQPGLAPNLCSDSEVVDIMQALNILPGSLGGSSEKAVPLGVGSPQPVSTPAAAVVKTPELPDPECFGGTVPAIDTNGPLGSLVVQHDGILSVGTGAGSLTSALDASSISSVLANTPRPSDGLGASKKGGLINLDGGTLINLDGGTLLNLDGGTLLNLDGGTLIGVDGGTLGGTGRSPIASLQAGMSPISQ